MNSLSAEHHNQLLFLENESNFTQNKSSKLCYRDYAKIQQQKHIKVINLKILIGRLNFALTEIISTP